MRQSEKAQMVQRRTALFFRDLITDKEPARVWLENLKDIFAQAKIYVRIQRAELGNFGNHRSLGQGLWELKIQVGPGYRIYYALEANEIILLLLGGDKSTQREDLTTARKYLKSHQKESHGKRK